MKGQVLFLLWRGVAIVDVTSGYVPGSRQKDITEVWSDVVRERDEKSPQVCVRSTPWWARPQVQLEPPELVLQRAVWVRALTFGCECVCSEVIDAD